MKNGVESEKIKKNLHKIKDFEGASGKITFDQNGDVRKPFEIAVVKNQKLVPLKILE